MKLSQILTAFIKQKETDFAILINGEWGSGKTYFVKNEIAEEIRKIEFTKDKKGNIIYYEPVYLSLYGVTTIDELEKKMFLELNPILKTKVAQVGSIFLESFLKKRIGFSKTDEADLLNIFGNIPQNRVLIFDDLERLNNEVVNEVLGFINSYTEHQNIKVIIVADERKIYDKLGDYNKVKEKLIRFTYLYKPTIKEIFPSFVKRYSTDYNKFLLRSEVDISRLFEISEHLNLRTLRFILDLFENVYSNVKTLSLKHFDAIINKYLSFLVVYSIEYKKGVANDKLGLLKRFSAELPYTYFDRKVAKKIREDAIKKGEMKASQLSEEDEYIEKFEKTYLDNQPNPDFSYFDFLSEYIHSGYLDIEMLKKSCAQLEDNFTNQETQPCQAIINNLRNFVRVEDDQLMPSITEALKCAENFNYNFVNYFELFIVLLDISERQLSNFTINDEIFDLFKMGMSKSIENINDSYLLDDYLRHFSEQIKISNKYFDLLLNFCWELTASKKSKEEISLAANILSLLKEGRADKFYEKLNDNNSLTKRIFLVDYIKPIDFLNQYSLLSNKEKVIVNRAFTEFNKRYVYYNGHFNSEKQFFTELIELIDKKIGESGHNVQISTINLRQLRTNLEKILQMIK